MTVQKSFKRLVRARMEKTGESYTAARAMLLTAEEPQGAERPWLATSDEAIRERTGRGWEEWFDALDEWGAAERSHREIARWVAVTASKTVAAPVGALYDAFVGDALEPLRERTATRPRSARFDWGDEGSRVSVVFDAKDEGRSAVSSSTGGSPTPARPSG
jgi:hypothetical protein